MTGPATPTAGSRLASLLAQATPGPWGAYRDMGSRTLRAEAGGSYTRLANFDLHSDTPFAVDGVSNARLAALAPDAVSLLIDMAAWVKEQTQYLADGSDGLRDDGGNALLARFAELDRRAAQ